MAEYIPPNNNSINFNLVPYSVKNITRPSSELSSYSIPNNNSINFLLNTYTNIRTTKINFEIGNILNTITKPFIYFF